MLFRAAIVSGDPFISTLNSVVPILTVPEGSTRFCEEIAVMTSVGERPFDCSAGMSRFTETWRCFPPYGHGTAAPATVAN